MKPKIDTDAFGNNLLPCDGTEASSQESRVAASLKHPEKCQWVSKLGLKHPEKRIRVKLGLKHPKQVIRVKIRPQATWIVTRAKINVKSVEIKVKTNPRQTVKKYCDDISCVSLSLTWAAWKDQGRGCHCGEDQGNHRRPRSNQPLRSQHWVSS